MSLETSYVRAFRLSEKVCIKVSVVLEAWLCEKRFEALSSEVSKAFPRAQDVLVGHFE